jgi:hypothetical protein
MIFGSDDYQDLNRVKDYVRGFKDDIYNQYSTTLYCRPGTRVGALVFATAKHFGIPCRDYSKSENYMDVVDTGVGFVTEKGWTEFNALINSYVRDGKKVIMFGDRCLI